MSDSSMFPTAAVYGQLSDSQLSQAFSQISAAAGSTPSTIPANQNKNYMKNLHNWSTTSAPASKHPSPAPSRSQRQTRSSTVTRSSNLAAAPVTNYQPPAPPIPSRGPLSTVPQAAVSTYASRLRTGATLLVQPIFSTTTTTSAVAAVTTSRSSRRGGVINYADPGSGDDMPDAGALDSDDSDFVNSEGGGGRSSVRRGKARMATGMSVFNSSTGVTTTPHAAPPPPRVEKAELDQSYLGMVPPARYIKQRNMAPTQHEYPSADDMERQAERRTALVPIRVEFETETQRVRDCFVWNLRETLIKPETFARAFCYDLELPNTPWADTVATQIRAQLEDHEAVATMGIGMDGVVDDGTSLEEGDEVAECRVLLAIDVQIGNYHLVDTIEWDLLSPLTPEVFSQKLCMELGLSGEAIPLIAHAIHEELIKHKKDAIEWGVISSERDFEDGGRRDRSGMGLLKDKTGLGLGWGRAPKDGRGPRTLKSVWRDWPEVDEFRTRFEILTAEEIEKKELERERASRRLRRETSKFQSSTRSRRR
ncbi:hypothetical protein C8J56DRAFT_24231 [Mycena floridula]|nr:hypothetical protein C8J56DRAFT_24231 [Mycena floridula]